MIARANGAVPRALGGLPVLATPSDERKAAAVSVPAPGALPDAFPVPCVSIFRFLSPPARPAGGLLVDPPTAKTGLPDGVALRRTSRLRDPCGARGGRAWLLPSRVHAGRGPPPGYAGAYPVVPLRLHALVLLARRRCRAPTVPPALQRRAARAGIARSSSGCMSTLAASTPSGARPGCALTPRASPPRAAGRRPSPSVTRLIDFLDPGPGFFLTRRRCSPLGGLSPSAPESGQVPASRTSKSRRRRPVRGRPRKSAAACAPRFLRQLPCPWRTGPVFSGRQRRPPTPRKLSPFRNPTDMT